MKLKFWIKLFLYMDSEVCVWVRSSYKLKGNLNLTITVITIHKKGNKTWYIIFKIMHKTFQLKLEYLEQMNC